MAEVAVINHVNESFSTQVVCVETDCKNEKVSESTDSSRTYRKHRFTIFIGYGEEAGGVLKRCEQLKCKLGFITNIQFLTHLIDFFEKYAAEHASTSLSTIGEVSDGRVSSETLTYVYDLKCKTFKSTNVDSQNENAPTSSSKIITSTNSTTKQIAQEVNSSDGDGNTDQQNEEAHEEVHVPVRHEQTSDEVNFNAPTEIGHEVMQEENVFTELTAPIKRKYVDNYEDSGTSSADVCSNKVMCHSSLVDSQAPIVQTKFDASLTLSDLTSKALKLVHQYMESVKNDGANCFGYVSSSRKLKSFLDEYHLMTLTSFTVRSSRSYIKKRFEALKSNKNENNAISVLNIKGSVKMRDQNENMLTGGIKLPSQISDNGEMSKTTDNSFEATHPDDTQDRLPNDESLTTGPLRWEFILGKPPIPFTGVPFFIIGNTQYQCLYASADIRTQKRREKLEQMRKDNPDVKTRCRHSKKRDCKAVMCIKSIITFPEFSIVDKMKSISSKKGLRKLKATTLDNLRVAVERGESIGHPSFWVHVPLPETHSTHDILDPCAKVSNNSTMDEISYLLQLAAYEQCLKESNEQLDYVPRVKLKDI